MMIQITISASKFGVHFIFQHYSSFTHRQSAPYQFHTIFACIAVDSMGRTTRIAGNRITALPAAFSNISEKLNSDCACAMCVASVGARVQIARSSNGHCRGQMLCMSVLRGQIRTNNSKWSYTRLIRTFMQNGECVFYARALAAAASKAITVLFPADQRRRAFCLHNQYPFPNKYVCINIVRGIAIKGNDARKWKTREKRAAEAKNQKSTRKMCISNWIDRFPSVFFGTEFIICCRS